MAEDELCCFLSYAANGLAPHRLQMVCVLVVAETDRNARRRSGRAGIKGGTAVGTLLRPLSNLCSPSLTLTANHSRLTHQPSSQDSTSSLNMSTSYYRYQQPTGSLPVNVPGKQPQAQYQYQRHNRNASGNSQYSASPPERPESVSTSGAGLYSSASSQYASSEYDSSSGGATSVDLLDYMNDRLSQAYNPMPMDKSMAKQAQM